jgi:hypothetical protein
LRKNEKDKGWDKIGSDIICVEGIEGKYTDRR